MSGKEWKAWEKKPARPAPRNPQAGRLGESRLSPGDAGSAEAEFDAEGSLREFPLLEDRVAAEDARQPAQSKLIVPSSASL